MAKTARILLLADTHVGFDAPARPRVERRRRGPDFLARFEEALQPALCGEADLVVHGGDLLYRARVPAHLVQQAMAPLFRVADRGGMTLVGFVRDGRFNVYTGRDRIDVGQPPL